MDVYEFQDIRTKIRPRLLRRDKNKDCIKKVPYIDITDENLLVVFYVELGVVNNIDIGFYISNKHLRMWNITRQQLIKEVVMR